MTNVLLFAASRADRFSFAVIPYTPGARTIRAPDSA
jgi:hypothetical protein